MKTFGVALLAAILSYIVGLFGRPQLNSFLPIPMTSPWKRR